MPSLLIRQRLDVPQHLRAALLIRVALRRLLALLILADTLLQRLGS